jgi:hypothetical protein
MIFFNSVTLLESIHAAFVEKILRVQPNVKRLYLLIRASDVASATERLHNEVYIYTYPIFFFLCKKVLNANNYG